MSELKVGDPAPDFSLSDQHGKQVSLAHYRGQKLLLYFYPRADTPGCTIQSCAVRDALPELGQLQVAALGISPDQPQDQAAFDEKFSLGFPLLADPEHRMAEAYGVWGERSMYGKTYMGILRSSFLIDEGGVLAGVWAPVKPDETVPNALAALGSTV